MGLSTASLTGFGAAFDQVLGFLQAQAGDFANHLDDGDLLGSVESRFENDGEFGLGGFWFRGCSRPSCASTASTASTAAAGGRLDLVGFLQVVFSATA